jgi:hypothetical protein
LNDKFDESKIEGDFLTFFLLIVGGTWRVHNAASWQTIRATLRRVFFWSLNSIEQWLQNSY